PFEFRLRGLLQQRPLEVGFADRAVVVGDMGDQGDVALGHARVAEALGDRVAGEEDHEKRAEEDQRKALTTRLPALPRFRSHEGGSIVKLTKEGPNEWIGP